ncbi:pyruvate ferredoxin oxidoreductase subunit gamma [Candidatus Bathyarchaeota archaeon]|nr:pyruvate ferredoxin oxidoreductase subunit gamma [Candidatus Bathyarchaeota archaeon]NIU80805.1 pyruvate ferredoxin oxidoreductase subunit gamma [Candidatus Bathyarchaeota archaeon]NIV67436.1 pyruvate ferredoxin oxidoreductase subunit gamma [Candidatus Bathyarchaeota archaeon]NIW15974.1 pyruvate ferredoxin oxidoreductase subunit gamma [Candidatus Bathyarchaeota archaeon]NIW34079.1 pyruvate ferredoxin oxidoreductase subunit gamma [Candidatus Bathyarchaeota archaeon]
MKEIRIHGRGGQGGVTAAELLAHAAFTEGRWAQSFAFFGAERRGAPVDAFLRIADKPNPIRSRVYHPDYVLVFDSKLLGVVSVTKGLKEDGTVILNTAKRPEDLDIKKYRVATVDATGIALELNLLVAGLPVVNTSMMGAFAKATGQVKLKSVKETVRKQWPGPAGEKNAEAATRAYNSLIKGW